MFVDSDGQSLSADTWLVRLAESKESVKGSWIIFSRTRVRLKFARVFFKVMQKPFDAGIRGNSGRTWLSKKIGGKLIVPS